MNTEVNDAACATLSAPSPMKAVRLHKSAAMAGQLALGLIKFSLISAPFLSMAMMILALWGVVGKTTYPDLDAANKGMALGAEEAKNYQVSETREVKQCPEEPKSPNAEPAREEPVRVIRGKIDWEHVV